MEHKWDQFLQFKDETNDELKSLRFMVASQSKELQEQRVLIELLVEKIRFVSDRLIRKEQKEIAVCLPGGKESPEKMEDTREYSSQMQKEWMTKNEEELNGLLRYQRKYRD